MNGAILGLICLATAPTRLHAQDPATVLTLLRFQDSVRGMHAQDSLEALLEALEVSQDAPPGSARLRQGFVLLRLGLLLHDQDKIENAGGVFQQVADRNRGWPLPLYGIGLTDLALARERFPSRPAGFRNPGVSYDEGAGVAFARVLDLSPGFIPAAIGLADAVESNPRWGLGHLAVQALRGVANNPALPPSVLLVLARLERVAGVRDSTLPVLLRMLAAGGDSGIGFLEVAREQFFRGRPSAAADAYWYGVQHIRSPPGRAMLRRSLSLIAGVQELREYDRLDDTDLLPWVQRFWTRRELDAGVAPGERLREHYRRYEVAERSYRPVGLGLMNDSISIARRMLAEAPSGLVTQDAIPANVDSSGVGAQLELFPEGSLLPTAESAAAEFDLAGQVFMRHGPPDDVAGSFWLYHRASGDLMLRVGERYPGSACDLNVRFCKYQLAGRQPPPEVRRKWETGFRIARDRALTTDSYPRRFKATVAPAVVAFGLPDSGDGAGAILVAFAVPVAQLRADSGEQGVVYPLRLEIMAGPATGARRFDRDTTRMFHLSGQVRGNEQIAGLDVLSVPPGSYRFRLAMTTPDGGRGALMATDSVIVSRATATRPALSDLVLGAERSSLMWVVGSERVPVNPLGSYRRGEGLSLYYKVVGVPRGRRFATRVELLRSPARNPHPLLSLRFDETADSDVIHVQRVIGLQNIEPGVYTIRVTIDAQGDQLPVRREARLRVTE